MNSRDEVHPRPAARSIWIPLAVFVTAAVALFAAGGDRPSGSGRLPGLGDDLRPRFAPGPARIQWRGSYLLQHGVPVVVDDRLNQPPRDVVVTGPAESAGDPVPDFVAAYVQARQRAPGRPFGAGIWQVRAPAGVIARWRGHGTPNHDACALLLNTDARAAAAGERDLVEDVEVDDILCGATARHAIVRIVIVGSNYRHLTTGLTIWEPRLAR
ncbi:hypothetical protein ACN27F_24315 [Solwaraspora sp. WMMB335]|uniref:hypothetical protein n=1 Tax=Solwaraspora sp. WMMB335 TaxID=3404118 RepID=UPI003B9384DC